MKIQEIINNDLSINLEELNNDVELIIDIQKNLSNWGLYPKGAWIDGDYGNQTKQALTEFISLKGLDTFTQGKIDKIFAKALLTVETDILLETAKDKDKVFKIFFLSESGFSENNLRIRDRQLKNSPYKDDISLYPKRLVQKPDNIQVVSVANPPRNIRLESYPDNGQIPSIDNNVLNFLHPDIKEACLCVGSFTDSEIKAYWLGKNALSKAQFWSSTKFIALLNIISQVNSRYIDSDIDNCVVKSSSQANGIPFHELAVDLISYRSKYGSSNSIGAMFKRFSTYSDLEQWTKSRTGNSNLSFRGRYGESDFYSSPQLFDNLLDQKVLSAASPQTRGPNLVSAYDLTRLMTMLGWHYHISQSARFPAAQWYSLESVVRAMGYDKARYVDAAIERLGLQQVIKDPVIISKVGWGSSDSRNRYEITYTALVQFVDRRFQNNPAKLRTFAFTLRSAKAFAPRNRNQEAKELDARIATEVTEILRRVVTDEL